MGFSWSFYGGSVSQVSSDPNSKEIIQTFYFWQNNLEYYIENLFVCNDPVKEYFEPGTVYNIQLAEAIFGSVWEIAISSYPKFRNEFRATFLVGSKTRLKWVYFTNVINSFWIPVYVS